MIKKRHLSPFIALSLTLAAPALAQAHRQSISHKSYQYLHAVWVATCITNNTQTPQQSNKMPYIPSKDFNDRYNGTKDDNNTSYGPIVELDGASNHITIQYWQILTDNPKHLVGTSAIILSASVDKDDDRAPYDSHIRGWSTTRELITQAKRGASNELTAIRNCMKASYQNYLLNLQQAPQ